MPYYVYNLLGDFKKIYQEGREEINFRETASKVI